MEHDPGPIKFHIRFAGLDKHEAGEQLLELEASLAALDLPPDEVTIERAKDDPATQEVITTLVVVLCTPEMLALARGVGSGIPKLADGIAKRLAQTPSLEMTITDDTGRPVVLRASGTRIDRTVAALERLFNRHSG